MRVPPSQTRSDPRNRSIALPAFMQRPGKAAVRIVLGRDGKAEECKVDGSGGLDAFEKLADRFCEDARSKGFRSGSANKAGLPREIEATFEIRTSPQDR